MASPGIGFTGDGRKLPLKTEVGSNSEWSDGTGCLPRKGSNIGIDTNSIGACPRKNGGAFSAIWIGGTSSAPSRGNPFGKNSTTDTGPPAVAAAAV